MKKISIILVFSIIVTFLTSCSLVAQPEAPVSTEQITDTTESVEPVFEKSFVPAKEALMSEICGMYGLDTILFKKIQEGAFLYAASIADLPETTSPEQVALAKRLLCYDPELFFVKDLELSEDGLSVNIYYNAEQIQAEKARQELVNKINGAVSALTKSEFTQFEKALWIYSFLSKNISAEASDKLSLYDLFVKNKANSFGFASAMQLLLNEVGIDSFVTNSAEGDCWVTANINGEYYHFNPFLESRKNHGQNLEFFGATDSEMKKDYTFWLVQDGLFETACEKDTFYYMRNITGYGVDFAQQVIFYVDKSENNKIMKCSYFLDTKEPVFDKRAQDMVYYGGVIYFADIENRNKLCVLDLSTGKVEELDSIFVTRMYARDGKLIYFDDVSNTEGSLIIG